MASLLIVRRGGDIVGQCDALCYTAKRDLCECVCEGTNHGVGLEQAIANTREMAAEWVARASQNQPASFELDDTVQQHTLF